MMKETRQKTPANQRHVIQNKGVFQKEVHAQDKLRDWSVGKEEKGEGGGECLQEGSG